MYPVSMLLINIDFEMIIITRAGYEMLRQNQHILEASEKNPTKFNNKECLHLNITCQISSQRRSSNKII